MHFHSLVVVKNSEITNCYDREDENEEIGLELKMAKQFVDNDSIADRIRIATLEEKLKNQFARNVSFETDMILAPYSSYENGYTDEEFCDMTDRVKEQYRNESVNCIQLPDGKIVIANSYPYYKKYKIVNGKVCEINAGPLHHAKVTKKTRKMKALPNQSFQKIYKTLGDFASEYLGYDYDVKHNGYGDYYNPNAMWDWYEIGGRWFATFLVKRECQEFIGCGSRFWDSEDGACPDGYMWVSAARKKDIQWEEMLKWDIKNNTEAFYKYEGMFRDQKVENIPGLVLKDAGISCFGDVIYRADDTLERFLDRNRCGHDIKYPVTFVEVINEDGWYDFTDNSVEDVDDEDILVSIDYHM